MAAYTYCVWYRVADEEQDTETVVRSMMARLACRTGICGQLLQKRERAQALDGALPGHHRCGCHRVQARQLADEHDGAMFVADRRRVECCRSEVVHTACGQIY